MSEIKISYFGHSCFGIESGGYSIVIDPYSDGYVPGLENLEVSANEVLCSHGHGDHNARNKVMISGGKPSPFQIEKITCPHDDAGGSLRGMNTIHILSVGGRRLVHLGDIGGMLPEDDLRRIASADVLMIPVGGYYTIDASTANRLANAVNARITIPMHYRTDKGGFPVISRVEDFLALRHEFENQGSEFILEPGTPQKTLVLEQKNLKK